MRPVAAPAVCALLLAALLAGCTGETDITIAPPTGDPPIRYAFGPAVVPLDAPDGFGSEPSLLATPDGALYFSSVLGSAPPLEDPTQAAERRGDGVWKSTDLGANWTYLGKADYPFGGGDSDLDVLDSGRILLTGQWRPVALPVYVTGGESVFYSDDGGTTWNPGPSAGYLPAADRNWIASDGSNTAYLVFNDAATGLMVGKSLDGGASWLPPVVVQGSGSAGGVAGGPNGIAGDAIVDSTGALFVPYGVAIGGGSAQRIYRSTDGGLNFDELTVRETPSGEQAGAIFGTLALDAADGLHYVWAETTKDADGDRGMRVLYATSSDHGDTWTAAVQVTPDTVSAVFPWIVAGETGHVAIGYYATAGSTLPDSASDNATWVPIVSFATANSDGTLVLNSVAVTDVPNHVGPICTQGTGCAGGRLLGDFFEMAVLPGGKVAIVFADDTAEPRVNRVAVQSEGPGLCPSVEAGADFTPTALHPCG